jgi:hypothetical protein
VAWSSTMLTSSRIPTQQADPHPPSGRKLPDHP